MPSMSCVLLSPEGEIFSGEVEFVAAETLDGWIGILPRHAPALFPLEGGLVRLRTPQGERRYRVGQGLLRVNSEGVTVLVDRAEAIGG